MVNDEFEPLRGIQNGVNLNEINLDKLIKSIKKSFDNEVTVVNISIAIENNDSNENTIEDLVSLSHQSTEDNKNNKLIIDLQKTESYEKIKNALKTLNEE